MDPIEIIQRYCDSRGEAYRILVTHGRQVAAKALEAAAAVKHLRPDMDLIRRGALLHDIGMLKTSAPELDCHGDAPYIRHGVIGRQMLEDIGRLPAIPAEAASTGASRIDPPRRW